MSIETTLDLIRTKGWRLHVLSSYTEAGHLRWGASIHVTDFIYGHSILEPTPLAALEVALLDAQQKLTWRPQPIAKSARPRPFDLDSIFN